jgi:hypothetical protein
MEIILKKENNYDSNVMEIILKKENNYDSNIYEKDI